jgi:hypothetical protein
MMMTIIINNKNLNPRTLRLATQFHTSHIGIEENYESQRWWDATNPILASTLLRSTSYESMQCFLTSSIVL